MRPAPLVVALLVAFAIVPGTAQAQPASAQEPSEAARLREDALGFEALINRVYAYPERLPGDRFQLTPRLREEAERVATRRALLAFAERALLLLADHHAITGSSFDSSWAVVPSYADLWIEARGRDFVIDSVRAGSPAQAHGLRTGDTLIAVDGVPIAEAVRAFWADLGADPTPDRAAFAARVLAAGRRDRPRRLTIRKAGETAETIELANLYAIPRGDRPPVESSRAAGVLRIRINDALGDSGTIAAFDAAMRGAMGSARRGQRVIIDLTDTPSGGNTVIARAMLGWFVDRPRFYQMHALPSEERETGIARQWVEQVLPRPRLHHPGPVEVEVGRWTGSMGEGLAIGFHAIGARVIGTRMAGLLGAIYDHRLPHSGLVLKIPTERLLTVDGQPREAFVPARR